jgi:tetratricopeptide (TPR) repeat protein
MPTIEEAFQIALAHHRAGELAGAEAIYRKILSVAPDHLDALRFLAQARQQENDPVEALRLVEQGLALDPTYAELHLLRFQALGGVGKWGEAVEACQQALATNHDYAAAWDGLGIAYRQLGDLAAALSAHEKAVGLRPEAVGFRHNLGLALHLAGRSTEAVAQYREVLRLSPNSPETQAALARILAKAGDEEEAIRLERAAKYAEIVKCAKRILAEGDFQQAVNKFKEAYVFTDKKAEIDYFLGDALLQDNRLTEAEELFRAVPSAHAEYARAEEGIAFCRLAQGDLAAGWKAWAKRPLRLPFTSAWPRWSGENLAGKSLLVIGEGGIGDEMLFASCLPDMLGQGARIGLHCEPRLAQLFRRSFPGIEINTQNAFDYFLPAGDLPIFFRRTIEDFPCQNEYLKADQTLVASWGEWLKKLGEGKKIGISWRSLNFAAHRRHFYMELAEWGAIFARIGLHFITLQGGDTAEELAEAERRFGISIHRPPGLDLVKDIEGQAGLIAALDAVICPTTMLSVLSAALGRPTLTFTTDPEPFRFGRPNYPWLPSLRPFIRQREEGWKRVAEAIAGKIAAGV